MDTALDQLASAADVAAAATKLYGIEPLGTGLLHATSVWRAPTPRSAEGFFRVLRLGPGAPHSPFDLFALHLARARADAIVTTGEILRREPQLDFSSPSESWSRAFGDWRSQALGKTAKPLVLVLSRGQVDLGHPIFRAAQRTLIFTNQEAQWRLESQAADRGLEIIGVAQPTPASAIRFLRREFGSATILLEAGPQVSRTFYDPLVVDELLLTVLERPDLPPGFRGPSFFDGPTLAAQFRRRSRVFETVNDDGRWQIQRLLRNS